MCEERIPRKVLDVKRSRADQHTAWLKTIITKFKKRERKE